MEKAQIWDDREWLEKFVPFSCEEIPYMRDEMVEETKFLRLGKVIVDLRRGNKEFKHA